MTINYLFVYGTLKPGGEAHYYLARMHGIWSNAYCIGNWIEHTDIGYPIISLDDNGEKKIIKNISSEVQISECKE